MDVLLPCLSTLAKRSAGVFCERSYGVRNSPVRHSWNCFEAMVAMLRRGAEVVQRHEELDLYQLALR